MPLALVLGAMLAGAVYAFAMGDDTNWDWRNYHAYNVWALLNGHYDIDVAPAGFQTYYNPLIYFPFYYLRQMLSPLATGLIMGALHGLNLLLIWRLTQALLGPASVACLAASVLLAAFGPMTLSEIGTSFADITLSLPIIGALILILAPEQPRAKHYLWAGLLIGAATGFKLTNVVFAFALVAAACVAARPAIAVYSAIAGGVIGGVITGGWWSLMLWREFGNPVFPLFNGLFPSPELPDVNILDRQFIPRGVWDGLAYPFYWLVGDNRSSEYPFRDARFAIATLLLALAIVARIVNRATLFARRDVQLIIFFIVSYAAWLALFAIQRYAIVLELLCGPLIVLLLIRSLGSIGLATRRRNAITLAIAVLAAAWTQPGDWTRRAWSNPYHPQIPPPLQQPAIYLMLDKPLGYLAPVLGAQSRYYQLADVALPVVPGGKFDRRVRASFARPLPGGIWELRQRGTPERKDILAAYGLTADAAQSCVTIEAADIGSVIEACPVRVKD